MFGVFVGVFFFPDILSFIYLFSIFFLSFPPFSFLILYFSLPLSCFTFPSFYFYYFLSFFFLFLFLPFLSFSFLWFLFSFLWFLFLFPSPAPRAFPVPFYGISHRSWHLAFPVPFYGICPGSWHLGAGSDREPGEPQTTASPLTSSALKCHPALSLCL